MTYNEESISREKDYRITSLLFSSLILAIIFWAASARIHGVLLVVVTLRMLSEPMADRFPRFGLAQDILSLEWGVLSERWDSMSGWQRGVIGTVIALAAFGFFICALNIVIYG